ncbi:MAG TPA: methyltransferase [Thermoanaerobaculia bacterium]|nr:methyltransferase [Thermoanaerobaculia bacterium]
MSERPSAARVRIFPPALPLVTILLGVVLQRWWPIDLALEPPPLVRYWTGGLIVGGAILLLGLWAVVIVRASGQSENPWKPTTQIVEQGPFRLTRNPMYLQMVLVCIGFSILLWNAWILLLTPLCALLLQRLAIVPEEEYLEREFGDAYRDYRRRVRRWL